MPTIHLLIKGKVQGVFYRAAAKKMAVRMRLTGWVKNTAEGNVEAVVTGDTGQLQQFAEWCRHGPEDAVVEQVLQQPVGDLAFTDFSIVR